VLLVLLRRDYYSSRGELWLRSVLAANCSAAKIGEMRFISWLQNRKSKPRSDSKLPEFLPILQELARAWESIDGDDMTRVERTFKAVNEGETKLGVLHSDEARRTYALARVMEGKCAEARLYAENRAQDETEATCYREQAQRFSAFEDCCRQLFWAQAKDDIGGKAWSAPRIGVREAWMIVAAKPARMPDFAQLFGGLASE